MADPVVSIIVVSHNTAAMTLDCLASIARETSDLAHEVIVIDNASGDGSADAIASAHPQVRLIRRDENIGFGRANNRAAEQARGRFILLLNPDTVVLDQAIERLVAFAGRHPDAMIWGGRTVFADGRLNPTSSYLRPTLWSLACFSLGLSRLSPRSAWLNPEFVSLRRDGEEMAVDIVTGCFLLIQRADWQRLGGFDPDYFLYGEEADLCLRAAALGARPRVTPEATIVHHVGAASAARADKIERGFQGKMTLARKHWGQTRTTVAAGLLRAAVLLRWSGYALASALLRRPAHRAASAEWRDAWQRRATWLAGYPPAPPEFRR
ncbi:MAG: glycosyltransferase family 2 protein [Pseudomonadota bacterium]